MASAHFTVRNRLTGNVIIGPTERLTRQIGRQRITRAPGSFVIPSADVQPGEEIFYYVVFALGYETRSPEITRSGNTLSWPILGSWHVNRNLVDFDIVYGVY